MIQASIMLHLCIIMLGKWEGRRKVKGRKKKTFIVPSKLWHFVMLPFFLLSMGQKKFNLVTLSHSNLKATVNGYAIFYP